MGLNCAALCIVGIIVKMVVRRRSSSIQIQTHVFVNETDQLHTSKDIRLSHSLNENAAEFPHLPALRAGFDFLNIVGDP